MHAPSQPLLSVFRQSRTQARKWPPWEGLPIQLMQSREPPRYTRRPICWVVLGLSNWHLKLTWYQSIPPPKQSCHHHWLFILVVYFCRYYYVMCVCVCVCVCVYRCIHATACCSGQKTAFGSPFFHPIFHLGVCSGIKLRSSGLCSKHLSPLAHLTGP